MIRSKHMMFLIPVMFATTAKSEPLTARGLYYRCYAHFTGQKSPLSDPGLGALTAGSSVNDAVDQCMSLLARADLGEDGEIKLKSGPDVDPVGRSILQTFHNFHNGWFSAWDLRGSRFCETHEIYDTAEPSLHMSRNLFTNADFSEVITASGTYETIRRSDPGLTQGYMVNCEKYKERSKWVFKKSTPAVVWSPKTTRLGQLVGIEPLDTSTEETLDGLFLQWNHFTAKVIKPHDPIGAGVIGTIPYLLLNMGTEQDDEPANGGLQMPRRWSKSVIKDLLCRNLPVLRGVDVAADVQSSESTAIPFRQGQSCMQCHATMDNLAGGIRHLRKGVSAYGFEFADGVTQHIYAYDHTLTTSEISPVENDAQFHLRQPKGRFRFRTYEGQLKNEGFSNLNELGAIIASTKDFYLCAAKKYYQFFTGIDVSIHDFSDPAAPSAGSEELFHRNLLVKLGTSLQSHQNLQRLVRDIISSPVYRNRGFNQ
jgi:hypothetical protein